MIGTFACVFQRDLSLAFRRKGETLNTLVFFVIVTSLFPLGVGAEPNLLREIAPGHHSRCHFAGELALAGA